jgi:hypothetical protein
MAQAAARDVIPLFPAYYKVNLTRIIYQNAGYVGRYFEYVHASMCVIWEIILRPNMHERLPLEQVTPPPSATCRNFWASLP